ncbi:hypothetical protein SBI_02468 [Streptomyces bingchenggensis BCW-1]|uniref:Uncharacterized protein n=1 Tax=Streptomyces bingchenggensis (strain BCW-1) TaxID=749414 RepID=D7BX44_STRBB|nr:MULTISPECIES: hypothetical protein [Streptomyces]ADI05589.1 hypothetical protein SBI_02468 [Streptomyces bingchenggensis BCW-1]
MSAQDDILWQTAEHAGHRVASPLEALSSGTVAIGDWLNQDPRRFFATWINDRNKPLLREADGQR